MNRRDFLKRAGAAMTGLGAESSGRGAGVVIVADPADAVVSAAPVQWAIREVQAALQSRAVAARAVARIEDAGRAAGSILVCSANESRARALLEKANVAPPAAPESLAVLAGRIGGRPVLVACGADALGLVYALLDLADRVRHSPEPLSALQFRRPVSEHPANPCRSIARLFVSEVEDKPWFYDRDFWRRYLTMLAQHRFSRFSLTLGLGYDFLGEVRDAYLHFAYPFLLDVPGFAVRARGLPDDERDRNLEMLKFIGGEAVARGLHFQLGLWTHGYDWPRNPGVNYTIEGLTPENHAAYCRDALMALLQACPSIGGVTFRIHGESGVPEAHYAFWKTVFDGIVRCGRQVEIDMHAKGIDRQMIEVALATGMPVKVSPKYWAEHMGLPYHQAAIRALEMPPKDRHDEGFFAKSSGSRSFMRYGYGDLLAEGREYDVLHRLWPGTQRLLLWGDPAMAAAYGRASSFCGSVGMEICEPLSFKGRKGSGRPGGRDAYADPGLKPTGGDWSKYDHTYRLWGRLLYNPDSDPETWRRALRSEFGDAARPCEEALSQASRVLPLLTAAHLPSAANNNFWPEIYTNMPIVDAAIPHPYGDTAAPKVFGNVSPLDPETFSTINECADELLGGTPSGKYSPLQVAVWLETMSGKALRSLEDAERLSAHSANPAFRRLVIDTRVQAGLGRFFAAKLRAGVLYALFERGAGSPTLHAALDHYRSARQAWLELSEITQGVYVGDITFGLASHLRGHWADRLPLMDRDIAAMEAASGRPPERGSDEVSAPRAASAIREAQRRPTVPRVAVKHEAPEGFRRGEPLAIRAALTNGGQGSALRLRYRHVNQSEAYQETEMRPDSAVYTASIPAGDTSSPYPIQYLFICRDAKGRVVRFPGIGPSLMGQPCFVIRPKA